MTTTQTDREMDARVAVEVMGWERRKALFSDCYALVPPGKPDAMIDRNAPVPTVRCMDALRAVPAYTTDPAADLAVLEHVRETWDHNARWRFANALLRRWRKRDKASIMVLCYTPGDYARAALAALDEEAR